MFGEILVSEILAKMFSADQIEGFFNQRYLEIKSMRFWVGMVRNWCSQFGEGTLKLTVSEEMNRWNKLIFYMLVQI